jgi:septal ring factor EnvC (AmiA/AmiB activator)
MRRRRTDGVEAGGRRRREPPQPGARRGVLRLALLFVALLASMTLLVRRQSDALTTLRELDTLRREVSLAEAERAELTRRLQHLESRQRVVTEAGRRLGMRIPKGSELVILQGAPDEERAPVLALSGGAPPGTELAP